MTEAEVLDLLRLRHVRDGNGGAGEYAFMTHVRNAAGFQASRTFDAVAMSLWPSRGLMLHAFEVKCSRSDWLRELKEPEKAEAAAALVDRFSLVVSDERFVAEGELPPTWGLLVVRAGRLVCVKDAPPLPGSDATRPVGRSFLVALLRAGGATPSATADEIAAARVDAHHQAEEMHKVQLAAERDRAVRLERVIGDFERASGVAISGWQARADAAEIGRRVRDALRDADHNRVADEEIARARDRLLSAARTLNRKLTDPGNTRL